MRIPEVLARYAPGEVVAPPGTVREALAEVFVHHPALESRVLDKEHKVFPYLLLFLNEEVATLEVVAKDGDVLEIVAAAEGG